MVGRRISSWYTAIRWPTPRRCGGSGWCRRAGPCQGRLRLACRPARPPPHGDGDEWARRWRHLVLRVPLDQCAEQTGGVGVRGGDDPSRTVGARPPEPAPVVLVVVDEHADRRIGADV